ncbi:phospholipase D gamma 1-like [Apium graveolens]|uniref:phospholipase D gamma 1-like n=1 Tax=Apium graveolens TaxID=4045 RepID=UPI003D7988A7
MDNNYNYNPPPHPYGYGYPVAPNQSYPPPPPQNQPYPPPQNHHYPPPPYQPYPPPPTQYHHYPGASYDQNYQYSHLYPSQPAPSVNSPSSEYSYHQPPHLRPLSHSSSGSYQYQHQHSSASEASLQHQSSLQYGSGHEYYQQHSSHSYVAPQDNESVGSGSTTPRPDHSNNSPSYNSMYPPVEDSLSYMHLSSNQPSAPPASALVPSAPTDYNGSPVSVSQHYSGHLVSQPPHAYLDHSISYPSHGQNMQVVPFSPTKGSLKVLLLHGNLDIWIYEAKNLPNMDMFHKTVGDLFGKLPGKVSAITSDPYVSISITTAVIGRTYVMSNSENPVWTQHFYVPVAHHAAEVHFVVKDNDVLGSQLIGIVSIPVEKIYSGGKVQGHFPVINTNGKPCKPGAQLSLSIQYTPMDRLSIYHYGVGAGPDYHGVPGTYFPLRRGGMVTLYQDAHVDDGSLPKLKLEHGMPYVHGKCWHDIFDAIRQAQRLIYITGWSVWHKVQLVRDPFDTGDSTLGELLKAKSQEGVRVLLLIWDDPTSRNIMGYKTEGIMATHDEETRRFFKNSSVQVLLCPRAAGKRHSWVRKQEVGTIYTHHQKTVIVDTDAGRSKRKILAFLGGLDLCDGRYDTPQHPIFSSLQTVHKDDYHNPTFAAYVAGSPREPWHDLHCKIDGPAAYDVLTNFEERWLKAAKPHVSKKLKISYDDSLLRIERMSDILGMSDAPYLSDNDPNGWHVQIFRSIDSNSVKGFPKDPKEAIYKNLDCGKNVLIDMSIHSAYVKAIRAAQHFIYIENQYFIGSSFNWTSNRELGANNLIPMEIALKIANKIRAHERFAVYIVIPMWPEGNPTSAPTQAILYWQNKTMQMMYETIYKALVEVGLEDAFSPQDYLNFYCLGNREEFSEDDSSTAGSPGAGTPQALCRKNRRFMIYVHSKGMIVDDEYVILGSANINQRSLEGTRDTEIAMGAYQPYHTWAKRLSSPNGQIYGYRMSLWAEHLGVVEDCFTRPESLECVRRVKVMGELNWKMFAADEAKDMRGHLFKYPVEVERKGKVKPLPGCETFLDVGGRIVGSFIGIQENLTI